MIIKTLKWLGLFAGMLLLVSQCSENPVELQTNIINPAFQGSLRDTVLYATRDTSYYQTSRINTQFANRIFIGRYKGLEARPILRFTNLPQDAQYSEVIVRFTGTGLAGDQTRQPFTATAYPILNSWTTNLDSVWNNYQDNFDPTLPLGALEVTTAGTDTLYLTMNQTGVDKFTEWADSANASVGNNYGFILDFSDANFIKFWSSINASNDPSMIATYQLPGDTTVYHDTTTATYDAFIYQGTGPVISGRDVVSSLIVNATALQFDIKGLNNQYPHGIVISNATLQMPIDWSQSLVDSVFGNTLRLSRLLSDFDSTHVVADSSFNHYVSLTHWSEDSSYIEVRTGGDRNLLARFILQPMIEDTSATTALAIEMFNKVDHYSYFSFYKRHAALPENRPRLVLQYWVPPEPRY